MSSTAKSVSLSAAAPVAAAAPSASALALEDAVGGLSLGSGSGNDLALPALTANPHTPFTPFNAAAPDSFGVGDNEVYRSLGAASGLYTPPLSHTLSHSLTLSS